jgi:tRNA ligase
MHRRDLRDAVKSMHPPVRLLALNWSLDQPHAEIHRICADRILARGTSHQTLHSDEQGKAHEDVLWQFLRTAQPLTDDEADTVIEMDVNDDLEHALSRAVDVLVRVLVLPRPDAERIGAALARARSYCPLRTNRRRQSSSSTRSTRSSPPAAEKKPCESSGTRSSPARRPHHHVAHDGRALQGSNSGVVLEPPTEVHVASYIALSV